MYEWISNSGNCMSTIIRNASVADHTALNNLYAQWGKAFQHSVDDQYFVAEYDNKLIAAVRLSFENNVFLVRSLFVDKEFRGCGVATKLLGQVNKELGTAQAYCIALGAHQKSLGDIGFQKIAGLTAPEFLTARRDNLKETDGDVILLKRGNGIEVRPILASDLELAMKLIREFGLPEVEQLSSNDIRSIYSKITANGGAVLGAFKGKEMVGTCTVNVCANLSWSGRPYSIIENIIVTKDSRNQGLGKYLLLYSKHYAASKNCYKVALMTQDKNVAAATFYTSAGFSDDKVGYQMRFGA